jgi:hypothetical protein
VPDPPQVLDPTRARVALPEPPPVRESLEPFAPVRLKFTEERLSSVKATLSNTLPGVAERFPLEVVFSVTRCVPGFFAQIVAVCENDTPPSLVPVAVLFTFASTLSLIVPLDALPDCVQLIVPSPPDIAAELELFHDVSVYVVVGEKRGSAGICTWPT